MEHLILENIPFLGLVLGILFGLALFYAGATNRVFMIDMINLKNLTLIKIVLFAIGWGMALTYLSVVLKIVDLNHFDIKTMNLGIVLGSLISAFGLALTGLTPGTAIASFGAGYLKSVYFILGGVLGGFLFTLTYPVLKNTGLFEEMLGGKATLIFLSDKNNFLFNFSPWIGVLIGAVLIGTSLIIPNSLKK